MKLAGGLNTGSLAIQSSCVKDTEEQLHDLTAGVLD
jgi:hypothetical protein